MTNEQISKRLDEVFSQYENSQFRDIVNRRWVFCNNEKKTDADLLFVGINPSYIEGKVYVPIYNIEDAVKGYKRYYGVFKNLAEDVSNNWAYMDLFYFRETEQKKIDEIMSQEKGVAFICNQLQLSFDILQVIAPKVIVVCNKRIHDFWGKNRTTDNRNVWMGFKFKDTENGDVKTIIGVDSDFITPNKLKADWNPKIVFSRHLSRTKKELRDSLKEIIKYALKS